MSVHRPVLAFLLMVALALPAGAAQIYSTMYVFGDSMSDNGNLFALTSSSPTGPIPDPSFYYEGRFLNGRNYAELLYDALALPGDLTPAYPDLAGTNYAVGGARSRYIAFDLDANGLPPAVGFTPPNSLSLLGQIGLYSSRLTGPSDPAALYLLWLGSNDLFDILTVAMSDPTDGPDKAIALMAQSLGDIANSLNALVDSGAREFLLPSLPDISLTPEVRTLEATYPGQGIAAAAAVYSALYNAGLDAILQDILAQPGTDPDFNRFDVSSFLRDAVTNPGAFGFTNTTAACMLGFFVTPPPDQPSSLCDTPDTYLYWDQIHPTATAHGYLAASMYEVVPEPLPLTLLGVGLVLLIVRRRQSASRLARPSE